jgi:hypothetical protein
VDIRPVTIPGTPEECQPLTDNDKNGKIISKDKTEKSNYIKEKFLSVFPNPVKNNATISYNLESNSTINLWITNSVGQTVKIIYQNLRLETGEYQYDLASNDFNSGLYFVHLTIDGKKITEQIVITK